MKYTSAKTPRYITPTPSAIELIVKFDTLPEEVTFVAKPSDPEQYGRDLYYKALAGEFGPIVEFTPPPVSYDILCSELHSRTTVLINKQAQDLRFISIDEAMTYVDEPAVPRYQQQAIALRRWRSLVWAIVEDVIDAGQLFEVEDVINSLPQFTM